MCVCVCVAAGFRGVSSQQHTKPRDFRGPREVCEGRTGLALGTPGFMGTVKQSRQG